MNRREHLLACLGEECAEVAQRCSKALRFGLDEVQAGQPFTNAERIAAEMRDLNAISIILQAEGILPQECMPSREQAMAKFLKLERFMVISRREGVLSDG